MANVTRYDDFLNRFHSDVSRWIGNGHYLGDEDHSQIATSAWTPAVDISEEEDRFVLFADLPGVNPKDIDITMENGSVTIKGERALASLQSNTGFNRVERAHGTFYRRFHLPDSADGENITAKCTNGVLEVVLLKKKQAQPKRITVQ